MTMHVAVEHIGMCGGLALAAIQAHWARRPR
jgi:sulfite exporter TauE/SafE